MQLFGLNSFVSYLSTMVCMFTREPWNESWTMAELRPSLLVLIVFCGTFITIKIIFITAMIIFIASSWNVDHGLETGMV